MVHIDREGETATIDQCTLRIEACFLMPVPSVEAAHQRPGNRIEANMVGSTASGIQLNLV